MLNLDPERSRIALREIIGDEDQALIFRRSFKAIGSAVKLRCPARESRKKVIV
jgi:hypothetical protein